MATLRAFYIPLLCAGGAAILYGGLFTAWALQAKVDEHYTPESAFSLKTALTFAAILAVVLLGSAALQDWFGDTGVLAAMAVAGLADTHAPAISVASLVASGKIKAAEAVLPILARLHHTTKMVFAVTRRPRSPPRHPGLPVIAPGKPTPAGFDGRLGTVVNHKQLLNEAGHEHHRVPRGMAGGAHRAPCQGKEPTRQRDRLSAERRDMPWMRVEKDYAFDGPAGKVTLAELFDGRSQLFLKHFMMGPGQEHHCVGCFFEVDHLEGILVHLQNHDVTYAAVARAPIGEIEAVRRRMGWKFPFVSSFEQPLQLRLQRLLHARAACRQEGLL